MLRSRSAWGTEGKGEPTPAGPDSAWSWNSFPVGNSELPPAAAAAGKGRLSHPLRGGGTPPPPAEPHPVPPPGPRPTARPAAQPSARPARPQTRKEGEKRRGSTLPTPTTQEGRESALPARVGQGPHQGDSQGVGWVEPVHQVLSELTAAQPSTTVSGGGHSHPTDRRGRGHMVRPATHNLPDPPRWAPMPGP